MLSKSERQSLEALQDVIRFSVLAQATRDDHQFDRYVILLASATLRGLRAMFPEERFGMQDASRFVESAFVEAFKTIRDTVVAHDVGTDSSPVFDSPETS